jgi:hypothetical protein
LGAENANRDAKQYWAAGQVLCSTRLVLSEFMFPDNPLLHPFNNLQRIIFNQGIQHLPINDAEIGVWTNVWFVYPFSRQLSPTTGSENKWTSERLKNLLEEAWFSIETVATRPFLDPKMEALHYLRDFPEMALAYACHENFLTDENDPDISFMYTEKKHADRSRKMLRWLAQIEEKWKRSKKAYPFVQSHPEIEMMRQAAMIMKLADLIHTRILEGTFRCTSVEIRRYVEMRNRFFKTGAYRKIGDPAISDLLAHEAKETFQARFLRYALDQYCDIQVMGTPAPIRIKEPAEKGKSDETLLRFRFRKEIEILEKS